MKKSFTLLELLIIISIIIILAILLLITLNPKKQLEKGQDSQRKQELTQLSKVFEDYYNDKNCYPKPSEVCYDFADNQTTCHICGHETAPLDFNNFSSYQSSLPCDPQHPNKTYFYQVNDVNCPTWYRIYTNLSYQSDPIISQVGCSKGCGPQGKYNYGVSSSNIGLESVLSVCLTSDNCDKYCASISKTCIISASFETYSDTECQVRLGVCTGPYCCSKNPVLSELDVKSFSCFCK